MKKLRLLCCSLCAVLMFSTLVTGCKSQKNESANGQSSKDAISAELVKGKVNLTLYLVGDALKGQQAVYDAVNKKLEKDINTTITVKNIPWTDYLTKYQLVFSSGENFDMAYTGDFVQYASLASKHAFMELKDNDIKTYAPKTWASLQKTPGLLKGSQVKGKTYMIPAYEDDVRGSAIAIRGDLVKKYNIPEVKDVDSYYNYLETVAKNEKNMVAFANDPSNTSWFDETYKRYNGISNINVEGNNVNYFDANPKVYNMFETDSFLQYAVKMRELNQAGVFPKDLLSSKNLCQDMFEAGTCSAVMGMYSLPYGEVVKVNKTHPDWEATACDITNYNTKLVGQSPSDAGVVLNPKTKNMARCLMVIDLFRQDQAYNDLTLGGIEGTHYKLGSDGKITETEEGTNTYNYNQGCTWGWVNNDILRTSTSTPKAQIEARKKWKTIYQDSPVVSFKFDDSSIKTEEAAINNTIAKYMNVIVYGFAADPKAEIAKLNAELKTNGLEKVQKETQTQLDAYVKSYKG